jgi:thiosulfate dehydrogenase (quinone) large subunit
VNAPTHRRTGRDLRPARRTPSGGLLESWRRYPPSLSLLRLFLGVTFVYAGVQKFADPSFFDSSSPGYIGTQLHGFAQGSPIAPLLSLFAHVPVLTGIGIAVVEIAIGLGTLLGIGLVICASAGFAVNVVLWLSATWHVHPYFLGSDSIYAVAWLALLVGVLEIERRREPRTATMPPRTRNGLARRELLRSGVVALLSVAAGLTARAFAGSAAPANARVRSGSASEGAGTHGSRPPSGSAGSSPSPAQSAAPSVQGKPIASLDRLNVGDAMAFNDPGVGPAVLLRTGRKSVVAFSRICTHAGCEVGYDSSARILVCPCHGAEFDPSQGAKPISGPTSTPFPSIDVAIDPSSGDVILPSA